MSSLLYIVGIIVTIFSLGAGLFSGSFLGFIVYAAGGFTSAIIFFALGKLLDNQQTILSVLLHQEEYQRKHLMQEKKTCSRCNKEYDIDFSSCPHCGFRVQQN